MTNYVLGFAHDGKRVVLIEKKRPEWQAGKLNGVGGKIEPGETPEQAMVREFREEAGLVLNWRRLCTLQSGAHFITVFVSSIDAETLDWVYTQEDEEILIFNPSALKNFDRIANLDWLVPLAMYSHDIYLPFLVREDLFKKYQD